MQVGIQVRSLPSLVYIAALVIMACSQERPVEPPPGAVALVDGCVITADDLRQRFARGPVDVRRRAMQKGGRHHLLDLVIDEALLYREARRRKLSPRFTDIYPFHRTLMQRFLAAEFEPSFTPDDVPEEVVLLEYEGSRQELSQPARRKVRVVAVGTAGEARSTIRDASAALARGDEPELYRLLHPETPEAAASQSGLFDREGAETYLGPEVAEAVFAVEEPPGVFPEPVPYHQGWAVVAVFERVPSAPPPTFEEAEPQLRRRLYDELRDERLDLFVEEFRGRHAVTIDHEAMELVPWTAPEPGEPEAGAPPAGRPEPP